MHTQLEDWNNGWYGVRLGLSAEEIDALIERLQMLKAEPDQHFHLSSDYRGSGGLGDITIYLKDPSEPSNMETISSKGLAPGETMPAPSACYGDYTADRVSLFGSMTLDEITAQIEGPVPDTAD